MIKANKLQWDEYDNPTLRITVTGFSDVYRFAHHLQYGQCEFADIGFKVHRKLKRHVGATRWRAARRWFHG